MTLLVSWIGVDSHGTASAYIAADSRISWGDNAIYDYGRKVFAFKNSPDILGYCGDVMFPTMALAQIVEMADSGLLFPKTAGCEDKYKIIESKLIHLFAKYPALVAGIKVDTLQVIYLSRDSNNNAKFSCWLVEWTKKGGWTGISKPLPKESDVLFILGSGAKEFGENYKRYKQGPDKGTSRSVFHCFCDTLFNTENTTFGGAPQLVGIYRKPDSPAISYGIFRGRW